MFQVTVFLKNNLRTERSRLANGSRDDHSDEGFGGAATRSGPAGDPQRALL